MFRLHGFPVSNFYNIVKLALLEKGLAFEEVPQPPSQEAAFLSISPLGKIPVLEVREGFLTETGVILDFLEDVYPEIPLFPGNPFARAQVRRLCHMAEIYVDAPFRPVFSAMLAGTPLSAERQDEVRGVLEKGARGIARVSKLSPWVCGESFTAADIFLYYCLEMVAPLGRQQLDFDIYTFLPGFDGWREQVASRDFVREVDAARHVAVEKFMTRFKA